MEQTSKAQPVWMTIIAVFALLAGVIAALMALAAPLGYRLDFWGFRTGFTILRSVVPYSIYIAGACLVLGVILGVLGKSQHLPHTPGRVGLAVVGAVLAGITWYVPQTYLAPEGSPYPSIHDISTDTRNPPQFSAVLPLRTEAENGVAYGVSRDMNPQLLAKLTKEAYPDLQPAMLDVPKDIAFDRALNAAEALGWHVVDADRRDGHIEATDSTFWFGFTDDIVIRVQPDGTGSRVDARSVSRVGKGDIGVNARRLRRFFDIL